jgi:hypothetical protein
MRVGAGLLVLLLSTGCGASLRALDRAESDYDDARYEAALEWLEDLETHATGFDEDNRVRYFYLRGMTEYRLAHRYSALHHLALAREMAGERGEGLEGDQRELLARTLAELTPTGPMEWLPPASSGGEAP